MTSFAGTLIGKRFASSTLDAIHKTVLDDFVVDCFAGSRAVAVLSLPLRP